MAPCPLGPTTNGMSCPGRVRLASAIALNSMKFTLRTRPNVVFTGVMGRITCSWTCSRSIGDSPAFDWFRQRLLGEDSTVGSRPVLRREGRIRAERRVVECGHGIGGIGILVDDAHRHDGARAGSTLHIRIRPTAWLGGDTWAPIPAPRVPASTPPCSWRRSSNFRPLSTAIAANPRSTTMHRAMRTAVTPLGRLARVARWT